MRPPRSLRTNKEVAQFIRHAEELGCEHVGSTRKGHPILQFPNGQRTVLPSSPSDHRWKMNAIQEARRHGVDLRNKRRKGTR